MASIKTKRGYEIHFSEERRHLVNRWSWTAHASGNTRYARHKSIYLHNMILEEMLGRPLRRGECCDHRDGDGLNNRDENLRVATRTQNCRNRRFRGLKGVSRYYKGYRARIWCGGREIYLGSFPTEQLAAAAYDRAALRYHGDFASLNF